MGHTITTMIECPFNLVGAYPITVNGTPVDVNGAGVNKWYRHQLCNGSNTGTEASPQSFASHFDSVLGAGFSVDVVTAEGKYSITWSGGGSATIAWGVSTGTIIRDLLGYTGTLSFSNGQTIVSDYVPAYRMVSIGLMDDTDWRPEAAGSSYAETDGGVVAGVNSGRAKTRRSWRSRYHPRDPAYTTPPVNPVFPASAGSFVGKMVAPTDNLPSSNPPQPFSMLDFWSVARGRRLAGALNNFQQLRTFSVTTWDEFYLDKKTCETGLGVDLVRAAWNQILSVGPWGILLVQAGVTF